MKKDIQKNEYKSFEDLERRKHELKKRIMLRENRMEELYASLIYQPEPENKKQRILSLVSRAMTVYDGAMFGWKIFRKFKRKK